MWQPSGGDGGFGNYQQSKPRASASSSKSKRKAPAKKSTGAKRAVKHGNYDACVRGVSQHRGKSQEEAVKICNKSMKRSNK